MSQARGTSTSLAAEIMREFARLTGLSPTSGVQRRYLWTDAFAVCNFLGLYRETGDDEFKGLALQLVDRVHRTLGRYRHDDTRSGWISGLDEQQGCLHPTIGGLRIGKELKERRFGQPLNERLEWDRDGQYYHYLTKWMHALNRVTVVTRDFTYNRWAVELAKATHARFVYAPSPGKQKRMYWKMSTDLSYPLVSSMGFHDPLDGLITCNQLQTTAVEDPESSTTDLTAEIADMTALCEGRGWATDDPLGIGGLLSDALRVAQLMVKGCFSGTGLLSALLEASLVGLEAFYELDSLELPAEHRLAFRELGLSIGLHAGDRLPGLVKRNKHAFGKERELKDRMQALKNAEPLAAVIEKFWLHPEHLESEGWMAHRDINMVMLATSIFPDGFLTV